MGGYQYLEDIPAATQWANFFGCLTHLCDLLEGFCIYRLTNLNLLFTNREKYKLKLLDLARSDIVAAACPIPMEWLDAGIFDLFQRAKLEKVSPRWVINPAPEPKWAPPKGVVWKFDERHERERLWAQKMLNFDTDNLNQTLSCRNGIHLTMERNIRKRGPANCNGCDVEHGQWTGCHPEAYRLSLEIHRHYSQLPPMLAASP